MFDEEEQDDDDDDDDHPLPVVIFRSILSKPIYLHRRRLLRVIHLKDYNDDDRIVV